MSEAVETMMEDAAAGIVDKVRTMAVEELTTKGKQYTDQQYRAVVLKYLRPLRDRINQQPGGTR